MEQRCGRCLAFKPLPRLDIVYSRPPRLMLRCASGAGSLPSTSLRKVFIVKDCAKIIPTAIGRYYLWQMQLLPQTYLTDRHSLEHYSAEPKPVDCSSCYCLDYKFQLFKSSYNSKTIQRFTFCKNSYDLTGDY